VPAADDRDAGVVSAAVSGRLAAALAEADREGLRLAARLRAVAAVAIACWLPVEITWPEVAFYEALVVAFAVIGVLPLVLPRGGGAARAARWLGPVVDAALVTAGGMMPNPLAGAGDFPPQVRLRFGGETYLFALVALAALGYAPRLVLWTGAATAAVWTAGVLVVLALPETVRFPGRAAWTAMSPAAKLALVLDPRVVLEASAVGRVVVLLLVTALVLAAAVARARRLVVRQADAERQRANLSRYFSANLVDELAGADDSFAATRTQEASVLFADVVGFTALAESLAPAAVIALLREYHVRMQDAVFAHGGTLDKLLGDGVMATFGTPRPAPDDAVRALACARAMVAVTAQWNAARAAAGEPAVRIGVGVHHGPVVVGDVGGAQRLEFAVVGDTVNVASRLESLTRALGVAVVASAAAVDAARRTPGAESVLADFRRAPAQVVRGRAEPIAVWVLG
jgi:adenylate cyclase